MKRMSAALVASVGLVLALGACGDSGDGGSDGGPITIKWEVWAGSEPETAAWQKLGDRVTAKFPDIKIKLHTAAWNDYWTKLPSLVTGGDAPCVVGVQMARLAGVKQFLQPLDNKLAGAGVTASDFDPAIMQALANGGKQYALPYDLGPYIMYYNKTAFTQAGLPLPRNGWAIAEWLAAAKKLTSGQKYGFAASNGVDILQQWGPTMVGAQAVSEDGTLKLDTPQMATVLDFYASLVNKEKVAAPIIASNEYSDTSLFLGGNAATVVGGPWDMINIKNQAKFDVGVVTVPVGDKGPATTVGGSGFGITQKCKTADAAMKAISVITGAEALAYLGEQGRAFPARKAQQSTWYKSAVEGAQATLDAAGQGAVPYRSSTNWTQVNVNWTQGVVPVINGTAKSSEFLKSVQSQS